MRFDIIERGGVRIAAVRGAGEVLADAQSALDLLASATYEAGASAIAIGKAHVADAFFVLSTGLAGEILQKFINYRARIAIYGDFSGYTSKPLQDFIRESNQGRDIFFVPTLEDALDRLADPRFAR